MGEISSTSVTYLHDCLVLTRDIRIYETQSLSGWALAILLSKQK